MLEEIYLQVVMLLASVLLGMTGFGNSMFALPLMLFAVSPRLAIPVMKITSLLGQVFMIIFYRFPVDWKLLWRLILPTAVGTFGGAYLLKVLDAKVLVGTVAIVIAGFALLSLLRNAPAMSRRAPVPLLGFASGLLGGSVALSGPPIVLFLSGEHSGDKNLFRGTLLVFFTFENVLTLISYAIVGTAGMEHLLLSLRLAPAAVAGIWVGMKVFARLSNEGFRRLVLVSLICLSLVMVVAH